MAVANAQNFQRIVTGQVLSLILGVSQPRIVAMVAEGMPKESARGYDLYKVIQWIVQNERGKKSDAHTKKKISLIEAQKNKITIETHILQGQLIRAEDHTALINELASVVATQHDAAAPRLVDQVLGKTDRIEVMSILVREMRAIRRAIADSYETGK